jgi:hypothetical protein
MATVDCLYKYGRINKYSEALFSGSQIWMASPSELNDPFECRPWFTYDGDQKQIFQVCATAFRKRNPRSTQREAIDEATRIVKEGRYRAPGFWETLSADVHQDLSSSIGLYCLSDDPTNILMWSHYGSDHKGYCLEFEATSRTEVFGEAQRVQYSENYPKVDFFKTPNAAQVNFIFLTKYLGWSYEREWRIIDFTRGPGLRSYPSGLLKSVIFGMRMQGADKEQIREWVHRRQHPVEFYQAVRSDRNFSIEIRETAASL